MGSGEGALSRSVAGPANVLASWLGLALLVVGLLNGIGPFLRRVGLVERARSEGARAIFAQAQFPTAAARSLAAAIGGVVEPLDDLAPDWLANLRRMGEALRKAAG